MIDTVKIRSPISDEVFDTIYEKSVIKTSFDVQSDKINYLITSASLKGSYDSSLSVRVMEIKGIKNIIIERFCS